MLFLLIIGIVPKKNDFKEYEVETTPLFNTF